MKAKCTNDSGLIRLTQGKVYEVGDDPNWTSSTPDDCWLVHSNDVGTSGRYSKWRFLVLDSETSAPTTVQYGANCKRCHEHNSYQPTNPDYICYSCSH